jgi:hypothetical protein
VAHMQRRQQPPRPSAPSAGHGSVERFGMEALVAATAGLLEGARGPDRVLDALLEVVHRANGGDLSDDVAILCLSRGRWTGDSEVEDPGRG